MSWHKGPLLTKISGGTGTERCCSAARLLPHPGPSRTRAQIDWASARRARLSPCVSRVDVRKPHRAAWMRERDRSQGSPGRPSRNPPATRACSRHNSGAGVTQRTPLDAVRPRGFREADTLVDQAVRVSGFVKNITLRALRS